MFWQTVFIFFSAFARHFAFVFSLFIGNINILLILYRCIHNGLCRI
jgi:hypothetical protein